jgi:putative intracellular protease/amidase
MARGPTGATPGPRARLWGQAQEPGEPSAEVMRRPLQLSDVRLEDYDAVYLPGGRDPMQDPAFDADVGRLPTAQLASGKPLGSRTWWRTAT